MKSQTMKVLYFLLLALICVGPRPAPAGEKPWEVMPDLPVGVFNAAASVSRHRIVVTGGLTGLGQPSNLVQVYDVEAGAWTTPALLAQARHTHAQVTLADGRVLVAGGETAMLRDGQVKQTTSVEVLPVDVGEPSSVLTLTDGRMTGPTAHALADGRAVVIGGARAVVIDADGPVVVKTIALREGRTGHASALLPDGRVVVAAGAGRASIELLDLEAGTSKLLGASLPVALDDLGIAVIDAKRVWIIGGQESRSGNTTDRTWILTLHNTGKSELADGPRLGISAGVADHVVADLGDRVVVAGGESERRGVDQELAAAWLLHKESLTVTPLPDMSTIHDDACAVVLGGHAWVIGGYAVQPAPLGLQMKVPVAVRRMERTNPAVP